MFKSGSLACVSSFADVACLEAREGKALPPLGSLDAADESRYPAQALDRVALCGGAVAGLLAIGTDAQIKRIADFAPAPGGVASSQLAVGNVYRVLDFQVTNGAQSQERSYKVAVNGVEGWINGGNKSDYGSWVAKAPVNAPVPAPSTAGLAKAGDAIEIATAGGINLRQTPGGALLGSVPAGARATVQTALVQGAQSSVYYKNRLRRTNRLYLFGRFAPGEHGRIVDARGRGEGERVSGRDVGAGRSLQVLPNVRCGYMPVLNRVRSRLRDESVVPERRLFR